MAIRNSFLILLSVLISIFNITIVHADDSAPDNTITLTINWEDDTQEDRPEEIRVELYRVVDDVDISIDSKTLTSKNQVSKNTWQVSFEYYYGLVWEYAFKITTVVPETGLYNYQLIESGNGTDHYTFDFIYGHGSTDMTIITRWDENTSIENRPESLSIDIINYKDSEYPERTITVLGSEDSSSATVTGLNADPRNYFIIISNLPEDYSSFVEKGDETNIYICTLSYIGDRKQVLEMTPQERLAGEITYVVSGLPLLKEYIPYDLLKNILFSLILVLLAVVNFIAIKEHRELARKKRRSKDDN